jgi:carboxypeptidase C (cathepsin A)
MKKIITLLVVMALTGWNGLVRAAQKPGEITAGQTKTEAVSIPKAEASVTQHRIVIGGAAINYTAKAGTLIIRDAKDQPYASIGYFAYTINDITDPSRRPITFAYNGGPGTSSVWLHMGALGPRRIITADATATPPPPYKIVDNEASILDRTDLVMIDPVGTGYSKAVGEAKDKDFFSVDADIESISRFIKQYITDNGRWNSPKYLLGESYGTTRSAGVVDYLQVNEGMAFNGVILISMVTDLELSGADNQRPLPLDLPAYTAVACYHKILPDPPAELGPLLDEVRAFVIGEYSRALMQGNNLPDAERQAILAKLHRYTGLSVDYLDKSDLRVNTFQFCKELLRERGETVGWLDARFLGVAFDPLGKYAEYDPQDSSTTPAFAAAFLDYLHRDLNFNPGNTYVKWTDIWKTWDYKHKIEGVEVPQSLANTGVDLAHAIGFNPNLRVLVLQGMYDLATTFLATEYQVSHLNIRKDLRSHIEIKYYDAGHMMYLHEPSLKKFKADVAAFIDAANRL